MANYKAQMKKIRPSSQLRKAFRGSSRGFTLIEVLIALALMGIIAIAFLSALTTGSAAFIVADERATAESLARSQMEYVKNQPYEDAEQGEATYEEITPIPDGYSICSFNRTGSEPVEDILGIPWVSGNNTPAETDNGLQRIKLVIYHGSKEIITMEGYKVNR